MTALAVALEAEWPLAIDELEHAPPKYREIPVQRLIDRFGG